MSNPVPKFDLQNNYIYEEEPWAGILAGANFEVQSTYHAMLKATLVQMVFGRDMILNTSFISDWWAIIIIKQEVID